MRYALGKMYFIAVYSVVPFRNHPKSDVNGTCLFLNLQVFTVVVFFNFFSFCGLMTFNVLYSHVLEEIK
jgi:hypothetical protein